MSKLVKDLVAKDIANRLQGVNDALLVNMVGLNANASVVLRRTLREKGISLVVVKNSLVRRATEGTPLALAFEGMEGCLAVCWGGEDFVSLVKEVTALDQDNEFERFKTRGGVMDGEQLGADKVKEISKWPNRQEQLSLLVGQILGPGATLNGQLKGPGGQLASQIKRKSDEDEG